MSCDSLELFASIRIKDEDIFRLFGSKPKLCPNEIIRGDLSSTDLGPVELTLNDASDRHAFPAGWGSVLFFRSNYRWLALRWLFALEACRYLYEKYGGYYCCQDDYSFSFGSEGLVLDVKARKLVSDYPFPPRLKKVFLRQGYDFNYRQRAPFFRHRNGRGYLLYAYDLDSPESFTAWLLGPTSKSSEVSDRIESGPFTVSLLRARESNSVSFEAVACDMAYEFCADERWKDGLLLFIIELIDAFEEAGQAGFLVTTGYGENVFSIKAGVMRIYSPWRGYFSKFPLPVEIAAFAELPEI